MKIILAAVDSALADAWNRFCGEFDFVSLHRGSILDLSCDAVVSPAHHFHPPGRMPKTDTKDCTRIVFVIYS